MRFSPYPGGEFLLSSTLCGGLSPPHVLERLLCRRRRILTGKSDSARAGMPVRSLPPSVLLAQCAVRLSRCVLAVPSPNCNGIRGAELITFGAAAAEPYSETGARLDGFTSRVLRSAEGARVRHLYMTA